jgi:hypothetical protein
MHFILLEKDWMEAEITSECINKRFPEATLTCFDNFGDFLLEFDDVSDETTLIISEDRLALTDIREDMDDHLRMLCERFPKEAYGPWDAPGVPKRLLAHLQDKNLHIPILLYTHSDRLWIDPAVLESGQVIHLEKDVDKEALFQSILQLVPAAA